MKVYELINKLIELNQPDAEIVVVDPWDCEPELVVRASGSIGIYAGDLIKSTKRLKDCVTLSIENSLSL